MDIGKDRNTKRANQPGKVCQKISLLSRVKDYLLVLSDVGEYKMRGRPSYSTSIGCIPEKG